MQIPDSRPTLEAPDDDPYLWLEEIEDERVLDWIEAQNASTLKRFHTAGVAADRMILKAIFDRPDNIPVPNRRAGRLFNPESTGFVAGDDARKLL
jgi:prolyl oligopeptidase